MTTHAGYWTEAILDGTGALLKNTTFTIVQLDGTTAVTTYTDNSKGTVAGAHATDSFGNAEVYADPGDYLIKISTITKKFHLDPYVGDVALTPIQDATTGAKGVVQLAGDFGGTAASPTVPGLTSKATDTAVVHLTGNETVAGIKTFSSAPVVPSNAFPEAAVNGLTSSLAAKATDSAVAHLTGNETIAGIKTFSASPIVPTPTTSTQVANKSYVDAAAAAGAPDATTTVKGLVQLAGDLGGTAAAPTVTGLSGKATDSLVVHLAGTETITGAKNFTGGVTANAHALVDTTDARLSDTRIPNDLSVTNAKVATGAAIARTKLDSGTQTSLGLADTALQTLPSDFGGIAIKNFLGTTATKTANYTLITADSGTVIRMNSAGAVTVTLPNSVPVGFSVAVIQWNTGQVTFVPASGAALLSRQSFNKTAGQYAVSTLFVPVNSGGAAAQYVLAGDSA